MQRDARSELLRGGPEFRCVGCLRDGTAAVLDGAREVEPQYDVAGEVVGYEPVEREP